MPMRLLQTLLAFLSLILGPPVIMLVVLWIGYHWLPGGADTAAWFLCGPVISVLFAALSAMKLPIESSTVRALVMIGSMLATAPLSLYYGLLIMCGLFQDCI